MPTRLRPWNGAQWVGLVVALCGCSPSAGSFTVMSGNKEWGWHPKATYAFWSPAEEPTQLTLVVTDTDAGCAAAGNPVGRKSAFSFQVIAKNTPEKLWGRPLTEPPSSQSGQYGPAFSVKTDGSCQPTFKMAVGVPELTFEVMETKPGGVIEGYLHANAPWPDEKGAIDARQVNGWFSAIVCGEAPATKTECAP